MKRMQSIICRPGYRSVYGEFNKVSAGRLCIYRNLVSRCRDGDGDHTI